MAMSTENQGLHEMGFLWENQLWDFFNSGNMSERKKNLDIKLPNHKEEGNGGEPLMRKKRSRQNACRNGKLIIGGERKDGKSRKSDHEMHKWTDRERRKKTRNLFCSLHALLPQLVDKADKSTIIDEAVKYIKSLSQTVEKLEKQKLERLQSITTFGCESSVINSQWYSYPYDLKKAIITNHGSSGNWASALGTANPSNSTFSVPLQPSTFQTWASPNVVLNICGDEAQLCIFATRRSGLLTTIAFVLEKHKIEVISANILCNHNGNVYTFLAANRTSHQFPETSSVEQIYKQAATDIMRWIS